MLVIDRTSFVTACPVTDAAKQFDFCQLANKGERLLYSQRNCRRSYNEIYHLASYLLPHYLGNLKGYLCNFTAKLFNSQGFKIV